MFKIAQGFVNVASFVTIERVYHKPLTGFFPAETAAEASQKPAVWYNMRANAGSSQHAIVDRQLGGEKENG
ncbi:hypothetical protein M3647_29925 [Paenibacillus cellulositrophicus]|uniref:hypothetical protein n=1 Tax=Paenibacillus cellulositrophicus TaxID=562959 RepID=UPI0020410E5A|nr:hypothetical protein [Paenibacillus cellulositrophicus]MCM3001716.1 hypothetical protein [Paenibacillus cellulositrophicus]